MSITLPKDPKDHDYEDQIAAMLLASGYYLETRLILKKGSEEVLEFDAIATPTNDYTNRKIVEVKSGAWGVSDLFKLYGQMMYTNHKSAWLIHKKATSETKKAAIQELSTKIPVSTIYINVTDSSVAFESEEITLEELLEACKHDIEQIVGLYQIYLKCELRCPAGKPRPNRPRSKSLAQLEKEALLTIELVPNTSWFTNVRSQVSQRDWNSIRKETYKNAQHKCQICGGIGSRHPVECHEIWEYVDSERIQRLNGFVALCPQCHEVKHMGMANLRGRGDVAVEHLAKINRWSESEARRYVNSAFNKWLERSMVEWSVDLGLLDAMAIAYAKT